MHRSHGISAGWASAAVRGKARVTWCIVTFLTCCDLYGTSGQGKGCKHRSLAKHAVAMRVYVGQNKPEVTGGKNIGYKGRKDPVGDISE